MKTAAAPLTWALFALPLLSACATTTEVSACKSYCATQDDGYQWALNAKLLDASPCQGYAPAFVAGCRQAVTDAQLSANPRDAF